MRMLDLFSGIGGFHKGFEQAGHEFDWVGFSEIDKYASAVYKHRFPKAVELGDITTIQPGRDLPDHIDFICGGFPCQSFSVAGKRKGFDDTRGTLFFEIARILRHYRDAESPIDYFLLENVKGLLSHDNGRTFATIYGVLSDLGYTVEFQLLNTRWWLPQNRERIYLVGYIGDRSGSKVFPIGEDGREFNKSSGEENKKSTSMQNGYSRTISSRIHKMGCEDTYIIDKKGNKKNNQHYAANLSGGGHSGGNHSDMDLIKIADYRNDEGLRIRKDGNSPTLMTVKHSETEPSMMPPLLIPEATTGQDQHGVMVYDHYNNKIKSDGVACSLLKHSSNSRSTQKIINNHSIRRLTPVECCRLQGFPDDWNEYGEFDGEVKPMSDTQRYKQCGNAVTVNVVQAVAERLKINTRDNNG